MQVKHDGEKEGGLAFKFVATDTQSNQSPIRIAPQLPTLHTPESVDSSEESPIPTKGMQEKTAEDMACVPAQPTAVLQAMADAAPPLPRALAGPLPPPANALPPVSWDSVSSLSLDELEAHSGGSQDHVILGA